MVIWMRSQASNQSAMVWTVSLQQKLSKSRPTRLTGPNPRHTRYSATPLDVVRAVQSDNDDTWMDRFPDYGDRSLRPRWSAVAVAV